MSKREPVKYTVLEKSLIGNRVYEAGETAEYDGLPAENLAPLCDEGHARYQEYLRTNRERLARLKAEYAENSLGFDVAAFTKALAAELRAAPAETQKVDSLA